MGGMVWVGGRCWFEFVRGVNTKLDSVEGGWVVAKSDDEKQQMFVEKERTL